MSTKNSFQSIKNTSQWSKQELKDIENKATSEYMKSKAIQYGEGWDHDSLKNNIKIIILISFITLISVLSIARYALYSQQTNSMETSQKYQKLQKWHNQISQEIDPQQNQQTDDQDFGISTTVKTYLSEQQQKKKGLLSLTTQQKQKKYSVNLPNHFNAQTPAKNIQPSNNHAPPSQISSPSVDKYFFKDRIQKIIQYSGLHRTYGNYELGRSISGITGSRHQLAILLMDVVHSVNYQGQIVVQLATFESQQSQQQQKQIKKKRIEQILFAQKQYYEKMYQIKKYKTPQTNQLPFCIIVPSYNNIKSRLYLRNLDSIFQQNYKNYHVVYIDDYSPDDTFQIVTEYVKSKHIPASKIKIIKNFQNKLALANIYMGVHQYCNKGEIAVLLDGDDSLIGRQVLSLFNARYQQSKAAMIYSKYLHVTGNIRANLGGSSRPIPQEVLARGNFRSLKAFFTSHLLTFYVDIFRMIKLQHLTYDNGTFFKYAYDVALSTPIIQMAGERVKFLNELTYEYRFDTGQNDPPVGQIFVDNIVFSNKPYSKLESFPFIDDRQMYLGQK